MASCKDCVHVEVCKEYITGLAAARGVQLDEKKLESLLNDDCEHFKPRSRFVELPCKMGDFVYEISLGRQNGKLKSKIVARMVRSIEISTGGFIGLRCGTTIFLSASSKNVFYSREAAEQALKERENNA